ncbi:MAG: hypothetical protein KGD64_10060 [Candidatus Heimdallarchaeota archaeon]|nr:hypothetical protein [Candidatus Heimdallarchaeota archaeon]
MEKTYKTSVSLVVTIASFITLFGAFGLIFLLAYLESISVDWAYGIWGVIFILLTFGFSLCYTLCQKLLDKSKKLNSEKTTEKGA